MAADDEILRSSLDIFEELAVKWPQAELTPYQRQVIERLGVDLASLEQRIRCLLDDIREPLCHRHVEIDSFGGFFECKRPYGHDGSCGDLWHISEDERRRALRR